jgi:polysaccharide biosynthesis/export protein
MIRAADIDAIGVKGTAMASRALRRALTGLVLVSLATTACSTAMSPSAPSTAPPGTPSSATPTAAGGTATTNPRITTLNSWILNRATPTGGEADLPLGPGDLIVVSVFQVAELSQLNVRIPSNGDVALPLLGAMKASGRSARQLEEEIRGRLGRYMHDPQVSVFVQEYKSQQVSVFGAVKNGGVYPLVSRIRVTDALAMAGALNDDADHVIYLIRRGPAQADSQPAAAPRNDETPAPAAARTSVEDEVMIPLDLESIITQKKDANLVLQAGDAIHVPRAGSYYVGGDVTRPGSFVLKGRTSLQQAVVNAGGVKPTADWDDVRVYRQNADGEAQVLKFSLNDVEQSENAKVFEVKKNDVVILGQSMLKAFGYGVLQFIRFGVGASVPF